MIRIGEHTFKGSRIHVTDKEHLVHICSCGILLVGRDWLPIVQIERLYHEIGMGLSLEEFAIKLDFAELAIEYD